DLGFFPVLQGAFQILDRRFDGLFFRSIKLVAVLFERLASRMDQRIGLVTGQGQFCNTAVVLGVGLGVLHHALDFLVRQTRVGLDRDLVFLAGALVLGRY